MIKLTIYVEVPDKDVEFVENDLKHYFGKNRFVYKVIQYD